ncbi:hypothetical protein JRF84_25145 [Methylobacterium organophilum]|uniref:hypothetical protein n=1 Tax=Methylobacterium organophilum TaxID=410 RepID=UPI0019D20C00|nr:hypothetical protein [Methylobacterium organophilum]MBN6822854.1 hypothetical protein [Methylobacterium organophilum]
MTDLSLVLPLRIVQLEEAVKVVDANGKAVCYFYTAAGHERRLQTGRLSPEDGVEAARICARALTDALSGRADSM